MANAILDGTDCVMLSEESAMGKFPVEAVAMLAKIATVTEPYRADSCDHEVFADYHLHKDAHLVGLISRNVQQSVALLAPTAVIVPTASGFTARMVSRFKLPVWIVGVTPHEESCHGLQFSYGVSPVYSPEQCRDWNVFARCWVRSEALPEGLILLTAGSSCGTLQTNPRLEIIDLRPGSCASFSPATSVQEA